MQRMVLIALAVGLVVGLGIAWGQEEERKTTADSPPPTFPPAPGDIWNFHFYGKKKRGDVIEFLEANELQQRYLIITHLEIRVRQSTRVQLIEHRKKKKRKSAGGGTHWVKTVRRSELFSLGWQDSTSKYVASGYSTYVGMKFEPRIRPAIEVTFGGGEMAIYAEGYWSADPRTADRR